MLTCPFVFTEILSIFLVYVTCTRGDFVYAMLLSSLCLPSVLKFSECVTHPEPELAFHFFFIAGGSGALVFLLFLWAEYVGYICSCAGV